jgi:benzylsuccinate CoA-transferase BbsF subunit
VKEIFEGLKVVEFCWGAAGPVVTRELAEHGATVVRVECHRYPDPLRLWAPAKDNIPGIDRSAHGMSANTNKLSISLDLNIPKGQELARKLVKWADILCESMRSGVMAKWSLDYASCVKIKEDIIYFSSTQYGQHGPYSSWAGYGMFACAMSGFSSMTGWPDRFPILITNNYVDYVAPYLAIAAIVGALLRRRRVGKGIYLDQSQVESAIYLLGPTMLNYFVNGHSSASMGNRDPFMCPHAIFPCKGEDQYVAITITNDEQWRRLCEAMGYSKWCNDEKFSTVWMRKKYEDELEALISNWTSERTAEDVMDTLQQIGVPAGVVRSPKSLMEEDAQLSHRHHFVPLEHKVIGELVCHAPAYRLSKTPCQLKRAGPCLGQDNEYVYKELLGLSDDEIGDLFAEGVISTEDEVPAILGNG